VLTPDWVNVVALTSDDRVVMVEQYRHGIGRVTLELPGGLIEPGESPIEAGLRELREETGFAGDEPQLLGAVHPNPAYFTNSAHFIVVREAVAVGALQQDSGEDIAVRLVPLASISTLIGNGAITHAVMIAAFHLLSLHQK
jgi:ADP-ribose pyrophosphatase